MEIRELNFDEVIDLYEHPELGVLLARYEQDDAENAQDLHYILQIIEEMENSEDGN